MLKLERSGPELSDRELDDLERGLGISLPKEYREFMKQHNGGDAGARFVIDPASQLEDQLELLFTIDPKAKHGSLPYERSSRADYFPRVALIIGSGACSSVALGLGPASYGVVFALTDDALCPADVSDEVFTRSPGVYRIAEDFRQFVRSLEPGDAPNASAYPQDTATRLAADPRGPHGEDEIESYEQSGRDFRLEGGAAPIGAGELADFERAHGICLPQDYRELILRSNGGSPDQESAAAFP